MINYNLQNKWITVIHVAIISLPKINYSFIFIMLDIVSNYTCIYIYKNCFPSLYSTTKKKKIHVECIQCTVAIKVSFLVDIKCIWKARIMNFKRHNIQKVIYDW